MTYKHVNYGLRYGASTRPKTFKEKTFKEKLLFWKKYTTLKNPITSEDLHA